MKFTKIKGALESLRILTINDQEFAIYMATCKGNVPVIIPFEDRPKVFGSVEELTKIALKFRGVIWRRGEQYAYAAYA